MSKKAIKNTLRISLLVLTILSMFFIPWFFLKIWLTPLPNTVQEQVDKALAYEFDGLMVYVDQGGKKAEFYTSGWKNREHKVPANPNNLFKIASISKLYEAVAIAMLVNEGRLSLDATLAEYMPQYASRIEHASAITLRMMVQHRSGIPNYVDHPNYPWTSPYKERSQTYELILDQPADFPPDKKYHYSNSNYLLLGDIMDKVLGYSYHEYIKKKILEPLGLKNTHSMLSEVDSDEVMSGYFVGYEHDIKMNDFIQPGGSMVATIEDVGIFLRALNNGTLLSESEQAIYSSIYKYEHTGHLPGYQSIARYHREIDAVVVQFNNTSGGKMWNLSEVIYKRIVRIISKQ